MKMVFVNVLFSTEETYLDDKAILWIIYKRIRREHCYWTIERLNTPFLFCFSVPDDPDERVRRLDALAQVLGFIHNLPEQGPPFVHHVSLETTTAVEEYLRRSQKQYEHDPKPLTCAPSYTNEHDERIEADKACRVEIKDDTGYRIDFELPENKCHGHSGPYTRYKILDAVRHRHGVYNYQITDNDQHTKIAIVGVLMHTSRKDNMHPEVAASLSLMDFWSGFSKSLYASRTFLYAFCTLCLAASMISDERRV
ncbi:hypothetical protein N7454_009308 [Penicillium verhagenii]|nr:hypothetical protein N7454_009308 [Penicillium verhagenii]